MPETINLISEAKKARRTDVDTVYLVDISCIISDRKKYRTRGVDTVLLEIRDESGSSIAVFRKQNCADEVWDIACTIRTGDTTRITGIVNNSSERAEILCNSVRKLSSSGSVGPTGIVAMDALSAATQIYVARIKHTLAESLRKKQFAEIDTRMISSAPPPNTGVYPLKIHYDGYGGQFHIAPTPVPQLVRFASRTTFDALFAISRSFTQTYRDPVASVESVIISVFKRGVGLGTLLNFANAEILKILLDHAPDGVPDSHHAAPPEKAYSDLQHAEKAVRKPEIQLFDIADASGQRVGRLCWPSKVEAIGHFSEYVLAEGFEVGKVENPAFAVVSINIDRIFNLLFDDADIRRIPDLSASMAQI